MNSLFGRNRAGSAGSKRLNDGSQKPKPKKAKKKRRGFLRRNNVDEIMTPVDGGEDGHGTEADKKEQEKGKDPNKKLKFRGRYKTICHLGKGSYGAVVEAQSLQDNAEKGIIKGMHVAIKSVKRIFNNEVEAKRLLRELHILRTLRGHDCIVQLLDIVPPDDGFEHFLILPLVFSCCHTDLKKILRSTQTFTSLHVEYIMYQILLGTLYMHSAGIAHRDLKPANILINADCTIRICDFGLARGIEEAINPDLKVDMEGKSSGADKRLDVALRAAEDEKTGEAGDEAGGKANGASGAAGGKGGDGDAEKAKDAEALAAEEAKEKEKERQRRREKRKHLMPKNKRLRKEVTKHVVTRWYRAPEVILIQQKRHKVRAIDMWSIGCIFAELLQMQERYCLSQKDRSVLFPGRSCFPLSADDPFAFKDRTDQLNLIFDLIGTPTREEISKLDEGKAKKYLFSLKPKHPIPMTWKFPNLPTGSEALRQYMAKNEKVSEAMELLKLLLRFDVDSRLTAQLALAHPYCARVRAQELEQEMDAPVRFEFEDVALEKIEIRKMLCEEITLYNPETQEELDALDQKVAAEMAKKQKRG